jgi:hypothetical protein
MIFTLHKIYSGRGGLGLQSQVSVGDLNELGPLFAFFSGRRGQSCVSGILVDGAKALPQVLRQAMAASSEPKQLRRTILNGCVVSTKNEWLPGAIGSLHAVSVVDNSGTCRRGLVPSA